MNFQCKMDRVSAFWPRTQETPIGEPQFVRDARIMVEIARKLHASEADLCSMEAAVYNWARGSIWIEPTAEQCSFLGIKA